MSKLAIYFSIISYVSQQQHLLTDNHDHQDLMTFLGGTDKSYACLYFGNTQTIIGLHINKESNIVDDIIDYYCFYSKIVNYYYH